MYKNNAAFVYPASDLILHMSSLFTSLMARLAIEKPNGIEKDHDEMMGLLAEKKETHEALFLEQLQADDGSDNVAIIEENRATADEDTIKAMLSGYQVVFQA